MSEKVTMVLLLAVQAAITGFCLHYIVDTSGPLWAKILLGIFSVAGSAFLFLFLFEILGPRNENGQDDE